MRTIFFTILLLLNISVFAQIEQFVLIENVYQQWKRFSFTRNNECDNFLFKDSIDHYVIDSVKSVILARPAFRKMQLAGIYQKGDSITFSLDEKKYIIEQLEELNTYRWPDNIFKKSKKISPFQIDSMHSVMKSMDIAPIKKLCYNVYTFSHPIFLRNYTICLFYFEERSFIAREGEFSIYKLYNNEWTKYTPIYVTQM